MKLPSRAQPSVESEHCGNQDETTEQSPPAPPDGYRQYDPVEEMEEWSRSDFFEVMAVFWPLSLVLLMGFSYTSAEIGRFPNIIVLGIVAMAIHEGLHAVTGRLIGLEIAAGIEFRRLRPYVLTYGKLQSRLQRASILAAPLAVFNVFCLITVFALAVMNQPFIDIIILGVINIVLCYHDLLDLRFTLNLPEGTEQFHMKGGGVTYYVPHDRRK